MYVEDELISHLHNDNVVITDRAIDVHIEILERKLASIQ